MEPGGWVREREIFSACLEQARESRPALLDRECAGELELRQRIESLLAAYDRATATPETLWSFDFENSLGLIGKYRLLRLLGQGGMGLVYEAEQPEPVRRKVALKVLQAERASPSLMARFRTEMQALARMEHPHVAKVFEAGETLLGRPYMVMEFVGGTPLTEYVQTHRLALRERVRLFIMVCQAVQHAHQKGIIHRDLKPSNVLVTEVDERPVPKVIDFGIAKPFGVDTGPNEHPTATGQPVGTLAYMSPEQAGPGDADIDTRTDIYSLGVVLYELLAGQLPVDPDQLGYGQFLLCLANGELLVERPSARVAPNADDARELAGDLDWIALKAMDPDRERRYSSAAALGEDLERYLADEPVQARPPSASYRARKFLRRYRAQAAVALLAIVAVLGGAGAASIGFVRAQRAERRALQEAAAAREVTDFMIRAFEVNDPGQTRGRSVTALELLNTASTRVTEDLKNQPDLQGRMYAALAEVHYKLGLYKESAKLAGQALERRAAGGDERQLAEALLIHGRALHMEGQYPAARAAIEQSIAIRRRLAPGRAELGLSLHGLAMLEWQLLNLNQAIAIDREALTIFEATLGPDHVETAGALRGLGMAHFARREKGDYEVALGHAHRALRIFEAKYGADHPAVANTLEDIGLTLQSQKKLEESRIYMEKALAVRERVLGSDHANTAHSYHNLGRVLSQQGKLDQAREYLEKALRSREKALGPEHPMTAGAMSSLAIVLARSGQLREAKRHFAASQRIWSKAYGPTHMETLEGHRNMVIILMMLGEHEAAIPEIRKMVYGDLKRLDIDLKDRMFAPLRNNQAFQELDRERDRRLGRTP